MDRGLRPPSEARIFSSFLFITISSCQPWYAVLDLGLDLDCARSGGWGGSALLEIMPHKLAGNPGLIGIGTQPV